ncbi:MAG: uroporphyrinogen-III synthase [Homoserinimonas sp.]
MADRLPEHNQHPLVGLRVLVPRGGDLGDRLAAAVTDRGGEPVIAPIIEFDEPADPGALSAACDQLSAGAYDWLAVTSATTVDALVRYRASVPGGTRVAVVGPATREAMTAAGFPVDFMPASSFSAAAMVEEWPSPSGTVLLPQSAIAEPTLAEGLANRGLIVTPVAAYETRKLDWSDGIRRRLADGEFAAVLLTSASIARAVADQGQPLPSRTIVACIGESTGAGARTAGLPVHAIARESTAEALIDAVCAQLTHDLPAPRHSTPES